MRCCCLRRLLLPRTDGAVVPKVCYVGAGRLQPLLNAGVIAAGDDLTHTELRKCSASTATVDESGW